MKWFLIPARPENIDRSIRKPVAFDELRRFLGDAESQRLAALGDGEIRCWAMTDGSTPQFAKMAPGDQVLISEAGTGKFNYIAEVTAKIINKDLGDFLWPVKPRPATQSRDEKSWEFIYFLRNLRSIDAKKSTLLVLLGHEPNDNVSGSRQLKNENLVSFEARNGPLLEWLYANAKLARPAPSAPAVVTTHREPIITSSPAQPIGNEYIPSTTTLMYEVRDQSFTYNTEKVERGKNGHIDTQNALAEFLRRQGISPLSPPGREPDFDLAWMVGETVFVAEVKSTTKDNEEHQLRLGLGQVLWYRHLMATHGRRVVAVLVPERAPEDSRWIDLCEQLGVRIGWPGAFERVLDAGE